MVPRHLGDGDTPGTDWLERILANQIDAPLLLVADRNAIPVDRGVAVELSGGCHPLRYALLDARGLERP